MVNTSDNIKNLNALIQISQWYWYQQNFNGQPNPIIGEVNNLNKVLFKTVFIRNTINYFFSDAATYFHDHYSPELIDGPHAILNFSSANIGHALSEFLSFYDYLKTIDNPKERVICISSIIYSKLPLLVELIHKCLPQNKLLVLEQSKIYLFTDLEIRRNLHFCSSTNTENIEFEELDNKWLKILKPSNYTFTYSCAVGDLKNQIHESLETNKGKFKTFKNIFFVKQKSDLYANTAEKGLFINEGARNLIINEGYEIVSAADFTSIDHCIAVLGSAKNIITSYGAICCGNRFYFSTNSNVLLLANIQYKNEYMASGTRPYWHIRSSHFLDVNNQVVFLDCPSEFTENITSRLLSYWAEIVNPFEN